jgi:hypothetical protein
MIIIMFSWMRILSKEGKWFYTAMNQLAMCLLCSIFSVNDKYTYLYVWIIPLKKIILNFETKFLLHVPLV